MQLRLEEVGASETESVDGASRGLAAGCCFDFNQVRQLNLSSGLQKV